DLRAADNQRVGEAELVELRRERLGLGVGRVDRVDHHDAAVLGLGRERMAQRERPHLLRQLDRMVARMRTERTSAAAEQVGALRAVAGAARTLLRAGLLAGAGDVRAVLDRVGAGTALGELPHDAALDQVLARLKAKDVLVERDRTRFLAFEGGDLEVHHAPPSFASAAAPFSPARRNLPGFGRSFGGAFFTASRTVIQPPLAPGTAPSIRIRPRSTSVCTTFRLSVVTRSTPMWPGIFLFLKVLPGSWRPPVEP